MKVFITREIPEIGIDLLLKENIHVAVWPEDRPMTQTELITHASQYNALISMFSDKIDRYFLNKCSHLKVIAQYAVGCDNIDISEATRLNIPIGYTPDVLSSATADIAFLLMLAVSRKAFYLNKTISRGEWDFFRPKANLGIELKNKTLGIFGLGRIGFEMAKRCKGAYNMNIIYCNQTRNRRAEKYLNCKMVSFNQLLSQSDVLSVHCSLNEYTKGIFNSSSFNQMKKTAIFVNTARGLIHNEIDLIDALRNGIIWGAGLDVSNPEPMSPDNPLLSMENVAILPHVGSASIEARNEMSRLTAQNIISGLKGIRLPAIVNPEIYND